MAILPLKMDMTGLKKNLEYLKPKQEWSEENEKMRNKIIGHLSGFIYPNSLYGEDAKECINWLKSIHSSWKPSEEQMDTLKTVYEYFSTSTPTNVKMSDTLRSLYSDLKKL